MIQDLIIAVALALVATLLAGIRLGYALADLEAEPEGPEVDLNEFQEFGRE